MYKNAKIVIFRVISRHGNYWFCRKLCILWPVLRQCNREIGPALTVRQWGHTVLQWTLMVQNAWLHDQITPPAAGSHSDIQPLARAAHLTIVLTSTRLLPPVEWYNEYQFQLSNNNKWRWWVWTHSSASWLGLGVGSHLAVSLHSSRAWRTFTTALPW